MSHNTIKISRYDLAKKSPTELRHYIQLINIDIDNYRRSVVNYPSDRMQKFGIPHLNRLNAALDKVKAELEKRENNERIMD